MTPEMSMVNSMTPQPQQQAQPSPQDEEMNRASAVIDPLWDYIENSGVTGKAADDLKNAITAFLNEVLAVKGGQAGAATPMSY